MSKQLFSTYTDLARLSSDVRMAAIENLRVQGVWIPCTDGILIAPDCQIGSGTIVLPGCILLSGCAIGKNCVIGPNTTIGDSRIGDNVTLESTVCHGAVIDTGATVGPFARIRPGTHLAKNVHAGNFVEVKNSNIGAGTKVSHLTYIGDTDMGECCNVGCGCATANYDGKQKHRSTVGDHVFVGCHTTLVSPVEIGADSYTAAGSVITQDVPADTLAIGRSRQTNKEQWASRDPRNQ